MNYSELLEKLYQVNSFNAKKDGLKNSQQLDQFFRQPHRQFKSIHIAGTNGKGSVATMIAKTLQAGGYKVGLYTSPHVTCFRERICINGEKIPIIEVENLLTLLFEVIEEHAIPATFFELTTYMAFLYFSKEKVDFAVIETGLGGRLDATNVILPILSIITSVGFDHMEVLGNTIESITSEKAGIIKPNIPVVIGPTIPHSLIEKRAKKLHSPLFQTQEGMTFENENQLIALKAITYLRQTIKLPEEAIQEGLQAKPPCRLETLCTHPLIILDAAHNPEGFVSLFKAIAIKFPEKKIKVLFGICKNKDISNCLSILIAHCQIFYPVEAENGRGLQIDQLIEKLKSCGANSNRIFHYPSLKDSFEQAATEIDENQLLLVTGTFFIMDAIKKIFHSSTLKNKHQNEKISS